MGYNRAGTRRTARLKRHRKEEMRLANKAAQANEKGAGLTDKVKDFAKGAVDKVGHLVEAALHKVTGKSDKPSEQKESN